MKSYLNAAEKDHLAMTVKLAERNIYLLQEWKHNLTFTEHKWLKMADSLILKATREILSRVNPKDALLVKKRCEGTRLLLLPTGEWKRTIERYEKEMQDDTCTVKVDAFCEIAGAAFMHTCTNCQAKDPAACSFRTTYQELELPFYDDDAPADRCPYDMGGACDE